MTLVRNETQRHSAALKSAGQNPISLLPLPFAIRTIGNQKLLLVIQGTIIDILKRVDWYPKCTHQQIKLLGSHLCISHQTGRNHSHSLHQGAGNRYLALRRAVKNGSSTQTGQVHPGRICLSRSRNRRSLPSPRSRSSRQARCTTGRVPSRSTFLEPSRWAHRQ